MISIRDWFAPLLHPHSFDDMSVLVGPAPAHPRLQLGMNLEAEGAWKRDRLGARRSDWVLCTYKIIIIIIIIISVLVTKRDNTATKCAEAVDNSGRRQSGAGL